MELAAIEKYRLQAEVKSIGVNMLIMIHYLVTQLLKP